LLARPLPAAVAASPADPGIGCDQRPIQGIGHAIRPMDLDHLNLRVRDAVACRDFYERWFGFEPAFEADGGFFVRSDTGFLLALIPAEPHVALPPGFHIGFSQPSPAEVTRLRDEMAARGVRVGELEDSRPDEDYATFRCWDPDGTEIEVFWEPAS
jgi:catechol 2,3-dioxygenase-like lactoylglutathione lyase family enzyme